MAPTQTALLKQVERLQEKPENKTCAECGQRDSCWASIIHAPVKGGVEMGVFICGRCYKHHSALGVKYVVVKSLSLSTPWTEEEVKIFERTGNKVVNAIFEEKLPDRDRDNLKELVTTDRKEEAEKRLLFITRKYKDLKYFCEKDYKRKSSKIARAEEEDEEDDPEEKARAKNRRALLLGGSLSMRNLPSSKKPPDDLSASSTHSTRSTRTSRTAGVLNRAASQRSLAMRKSNSNRDLMGRLNNISLGPSSPKGKAEQENSSTNTADTETSESSEDQDPLPPPKKGLRKSASMDERPATKSLMADLQSSESSAEQDPLPAPPKRGIRKSSSMDDRPQTQSLMVECRQNSLRGLRKTLSNRNLNNLSNMGGGPGRSLSSRNLMQLPSALQVPKPSAEPPNARLRKALSAKNLMSQVDTGQAEKGPEALQKSPSSRSLGRPGMRKSFSGKSLVQQRPAGPLRKSFSGRSLLLENNNASSPLNEQNNASLRDLRKSFSNKDLQAALAEQDQTEGGPGALTRTPSSGSLMRPEMRKSFSGRSLQKPGGQLRKSFSGRSLTMNDAADKPKHLDVDKKLSPRNLKKSLSSKDLKANNLQSPGRKKPPSRAKSMRNLLGKAGSGSGNRPSLRKSFSGRSLDKPSHSERDSKEKEKEPDNLHALSRRSPKKSKSMRNLMADAGSNGSGHKRPLLDSGKAMGDRRSAMRKSMSFKGLRPSKSNDNLAGGSSHSRMRRGSSNRNLMKDGGSSHSSRMQRTSSARNLMGDKPKGSSNSSRMQRTSSARNLRGDDAGGGSGGSTRMQRSSSARNLMGDNAGGGSGGSTRMQRTSSARNIMGDNAGGGSGGSTRMQRTSSGPNLADDNLGAGSGHMRPEHLGLSSSKPNPKPARREQSILVKDLDADTLCPSRRDLYDPDAKGLALLMQDSEMSMAGLSFSGAPAETFNSFRNGGGPVGPLGRSSSPMRYSSPTRSGRLGDAVEVIQEECDDSKHDHEGQGCLASCHGNGLLDSRRDSDHACEQRKTPRRTQSAEYSSHQDFQSSQEKRPSRSPRRHSNESSGWHSASNHGGRGMTRAASMRGLHSESPSRRVSFDKSKHDRQSTLQDGSTSSGGRGSKHRRGDLGESSGSSRRERRRSKSPSSRSSKSRRGSDASLGGSSSSRHHRGEKGHSHKERRRSRSPTSRSSRSEGNHRRDSDNGGSRHNRRDSNGKSSDHHRSSSRKDSHGASRRSSFDERSHREKRTSGGDHSSFLKEVDRFIDSVGVDIEHEEFWWKMIDKWVESA